jgi:acyl transferase domain-containing protein/NAD(P)-dependent dehydrogenase (short-subunit alcohol dehydrogenase family)
MNGTAWRSDALARRGPPGGSRTPVAIVGLGAILPEAPSAPAFWQNIRSRRYSITEVPSERWRVEDYYDSDPLAQDKTYSKIGAWVRNFTFDWKGFRIPPKVAAAMDEGQQWAVTIAAEALADYGYPARPLDTERTGVILGAAMGGELHYITSLRVFFPEYARALAEVGEFRALPEPAQVALIEGMRAQVGRRIPGITEDSMPGELPNVIAGRVANVFNLRGPNFITDAACASSFAAIESACDLLAEGKVDAVLCGGVDRNMGPSTFVKFCKIGALSATGSRPFAEGADGFVMGEGAAAFLLKRLDDAERDGDKIYAVIRGVAGSSDGKGKGITAPNPQGQILAVRRAWEDAGLDPATCGLVEAHGTSTRVGDVVEVQSLAECFCGAPRGSVGLGSAKSNIGHLKAGAGAAGLLKAVYAIHHAELPPTLQAERPNPAIDFDATPFFLVREPRAWETKDGTPRRGGVSAYGFGGTNFHLVLEEHRPGMLRGERRAFVSSKIPTDPRRETPEQPPLLRGVLALGADNATLLAQALDDTSARIATGWAPAQQPPSSEVLAAPERLVIDYGTPDELLGRVKAARQALGGEGAAGATHPAWRALGNKGVFRGSGPAAGAVAFLFPGQGSQYANMGRSLIDLPPVRETFAEADQVMTPILGRPLSEFILCDQNDPSQMKAAEEALRQTAITQPAVLTLDIALHRVLLAYGIRPDFVMGHSLGEYAALVAAGVMPFAHALEAAAARGAEMTKVSVEDNGWMAAVMAPFRVVEATLREVDGYVVPANLNSAKQCVIGGASEAVERAIALFDAKGYQAQRIPVSHAFHTAIVGPAGPALREVLNRLDVRAPVTPVVSNVTGDFHPGDPTAIKDLLERQIASPVQWVRGLETLYAAGCRALVEVGPKRALKGFVDEALAGREGVVSVLTCHPKTGEAASLNQALAALWAAGYGAQDETNVSSAAASSAAEGAGRTALRLRREDDKCVSGGNGAMNKGNGGNGSNKIRVRPGDGASAGSQGTDGVDVLASALSIALDRITELNISAANPVATADRVSPAPWDRNATPAGSVVITGTGLGLPGQRKDIMDPDNALRVLSGEQLIDLVPEPYRQEILARRITRLVKGENGGGSFQVITDPDEVIRLAGRGGRFDLASEYGVPDKLIETLDVTSRLAMAAGLDALREAGIPLVQTWRGTSTGKHLPDRWTIPASMRDETGVIFASAFPGGSALADEFERYYTWEKRLALLSELEDLRRYVRDFDTQAEIVRRIARIRDEIAAQPYEFDRRFIFRVLSMGHSQFAEYIGARGPNTQINAACASTTQAIALAEDWIRSGRCRRVLVIAGDDVTGDALMTWVGAGFLALGAAATDDKVGEAALPFDRRRHGTLLGMGACALVVESEDAVAERGMRGIVELLSSETANSAYHGSRLDTDHISDVMEQLLSTAEKRFGVNRYAIAPYMVFVSHETYTPARGGSASAEVVALRKSFGPAARHIVVANTKGFTGHPMGVGVEDVLAVKMLEHGMVPPVPNFEEPDPDLGVLNLSRGGSYPIGYALHLAAGFGSQIAMTFLRRIPGGPERVDDRIRYQHWLDAVSGYDGATLETSQRVLRVQSREAPGHSPAPSAWRRGTGPSLRAAAPGDGLPGPFRPEPNWKVAELLDDRPVARAPQIIPTPPPAHTRPASPVGYAQAAPVPVAASQPIAGATGAPVVEAPQPAASIPAPAATIAPPAPAIDAVTAKVLEVVADKTGYPSDMLELDLDLEADLGIDTVKQAETFAAIRQAYEIPPQQGLSLRDYPTLRAVVDFVRKMRPDLALETGPAEVASPAVAVDADEGEKGSGQPAPAADLVTSRVLAIVAEKTGYPEDMLDLDLDLEADLGVDTVKQAETFATIRQTYDIPPQPGLSLRDYPTLANVIAFVREKRPDLAGEEASAEATRPFDGVAAAEQRPPEQVTHATQARPQPGNLEEANRIPRRVPKPSLRPPLEMRKPTGVVLSEGSRVVVMLDEGGAGRELVRRLAEARVEPLVLEPGTDIAEMLAAIEAWKVAGPVEGVYWLPALDVEPALEQLDIMEWRELNRRRVKNFRAVMRALYEQIAGPGAFLVSGTRLGGLHGYGEDGATAPLGGAVTGFTKAYRVEQSLQEGGRGLLVKAVDFEADLPNAQVARWLIAETLIDPGVVEVGYRHCLCYTINLADEPPAGDGEGLALNASTVAVVTGAAGGITSAIVADLAAAGCGIFYLLDLAPLPERDDPYVARLREGRDALKQALIDEARAGGQKPKPAEIDRRIAAVERQSAALAAVEAVEAAGGRALYRSLDLRDSDAVAAVIDEVRREHGRIDALIHAAGLLIDKMLPDKQPEQFDLVYDVKADGFFNLLKATQGMPIGACVSFSSVAGRFGNNGQSDYSAANDLLCKMTLAMPRWRPQTRAIAIDWTAWGGIGMAARGSVPQVMAALGVDMLPPECGIATVRRELLCGASHGEVLVAGRLGAWLEERDPTGGLDRERAAETLAALRPRYPMLGEVVAAPAHGGLRIETTLDPKEQPFLYDHAPDPGQPWLPGVMAIEALAEAAALTAPGYRVAAVEDVVMSGAFKFFRGEPRTLHLDVLLRPGHGTELLAEAVLKSVTQPAKAGLPAQIREHFSARVRLTREAEAGGATALPPDRGELPIAAEEIYAAFFHGPAYRVVEGARVEADGALAMLANGLPPNASPADAETLMAPRLVELCFQAAALQSLKTRGAMAFPAGLKSLQVYRQEPGPDGPRLWCRMRSCDEDTFDGEVVDETGAVYVGLEGFRTVARPG